MQNFKFKNPTKLVFGKGMIASLSSEIEKGSKIMITYGGGSIKKNGVYDQVKEALKDYDVREFGGIEPNPQFSTLMKCVEMIREEKVDILLAVGGGSVIDGTKFIAAAVNYEGDPWEFLTNDGASIKSGRTMTLASVLTLPATGSEMNEGAVISRKETEEKMAFHNPEGFPKFSILDPEVCYSLPKNQRANGVADTFCHTLEQYATYPSESRIQDRFAEGILLTLKELGAEIVNGENNYDTMANYMMAATMGLNGFISMGVPQDWATHMIGHELTALYGLDHGVTLSIVGPALYDVTREGKKEKLLQYGERVWNITEGDDNQKIDATIAATRSFYESLGIKTRLSEYGITDEKFDFIASRFEARGWNLGEKAAITPAVVKEILKKAL